MDIVKLMESYAAVVKLGSFTKAAKEVGATRAMISKRIKVLESRLSVKLLNRNTHGLSVTAAGADYYENCVPLLSSLRALDERMQDKRAAPRGDLRILSTKTFSETVLGPIVSEFCGMHPEVSIQITLIDRDSESYGTHLISGGYDMAILTFPVGDSAFVARPIGTLQRVLVASPAYLKKVGAPSRPANLTKYNCLDPSGALFSNWELTGPSGSTTTVRVTGTLRTNGTLIVRHAALVGLGIAVIREYLVATHLQDGSLIRVLPDYAMDEKTIYLVYQKDSYQPLRIKLFAEHLTTRMQALTRHSPPASLKAKRVR
jgi:DNA-binding transcriptional LysR family regulator